MTVRWKPLLILSGLFVVVALGGLFAFTLVRGNRSTESILAKARTERQSKRYDEAEIDFKRALQQDGRNPELHLEFADFYAEWAKSAPADRVAKLELSRRAYLGEASKFGPSLVKPVKMLLTAAVDAEEHAEAVSRATKLLTLEPENSLAHYVIASDLLDESSPNMSEIKRHQVFVDKATPRPVHAVWLAARIAQANKDDGQLKAALVASRIVKDAKDLGTLDAMALFRLRALDVQTDDPNASMADRVAAVNQSATGLTSDAEVDPLRIARVSRVMERVQGVLVTKRDLKTLDESLEKVSETIFRKALEAKGGADLGVYFAYADHLRFRDNRKECLTVIEDAFKSPAARKQENSEAALSLHALAVHAILTANEDPKRFETAAPHIKALIDGPNPRFRAFGHMYQGQTEIEQLSAMSAKNPEGGAAESKLRSSALSHLKTAAQDLPDLAEAQARYGVALILTRETELGRVYLQKASRLGNLEARYQIWAAWAMVHGGYPEYAEPIVQGLLSEIKAGRLAPEMAGVLHLVYAEIHQARKTPEELAKAVESYQMAFANGQKPTATVQLRLAQIELMLNKTGDAYTRLDAMSKANQDSPSCEMLAVNTLRGMKKFAEAEARLKSARTKYPKSSELISLQAEILIGDKKVEEADKLVATALAGDPDNVTLNELRAWILADALKKPAEARALLSGIADRCDRSSPLVRLCQLDLRARDYEAAAATIAKIRNRWKEASIADMLDAQLALSKGNPRLASSFYDAALKKDPKNKLILYWKAQLDGQTDPQAASKVLQSLASESSVKEVDNNLSLMTAAQAALANLQLENGDLNGAIERFQGLMKENAPANVQRDVRWNLVRANIAKKQWPAAKAELETILADTKNAPSAEECVSAAIYYHNNNEPAKAETIILAVLAEQPGHPWAVSVQTQALAKAQKFDEAKALVRKAIDNQTDKAKTPAAFYLLLAAIENSIPPVTDSLKRSIAVVEEGLIGQPKSVDLAQAKARLLGLSGDRKGAIAFIETMAKDEPNGAFTRVLINLLRDSRDYAGAEKVTTELLKSNPKDAAVAISLVRLVASQAIEANGKGERPLVETLNSRLAGMIRDFRGQFPDDPTFVQLDCELAARRGEISRAITLTNEIDKMSKGSSLGPILRAQIYSMQDRPREVAASYTEALDKNPRQSDVRLMLAQTNLKLHDYEAAIKNAKLVLEVDPDQQGALLINARALSASEGAPAAVAANRTAAIALLTDAIKRNPKFADAYHLLAEVHINNRSRDLAIAALRDGLKAIPEDANGLSIAIRVLCEPAGPGKPALPANLVAAKALAEEFAGKDKDGAMCQAAAVGFHRSMQLITALPWAEKAASLSKSLSTRLNLGDLLLSLAEMHNGAERTDYLNRSLVVFDGVLKEQPLNVEAINNKAWILHTYLNRSQEALEIADNLAKRADNSVLPAEFFDTLGTIQQSLGRKADAEESFGKGLKKSPSLPILNFHMAKLIAEDESRARRAASYVENAKAGANQLSPDLVAELKTLSDKVNR